MHKPHVFNPENIHKLDNPERLKLLPPKSLLIDFGLAEGNTFLDYGAGAGYFSFPALEIVGKMGTVIAADISEVMIDELKKRIVENNNADINVIKVKNNFLNLPDNYVDFALLSLVLHEIEDTAHLLKEIKRVIKVNGKFAIIEWKKEDMENGPPMTDRLSIEEVKDILTSAEFDDIKANDINKSHYSVISVKK